MSGACKSYKWEHWEGNRPVPTARAQAQGLDVLHGTGGVTGEGRKGLQPLSELGGTLLHPSAVKSSHNDLCTGADSHRGMDRIDVYFFLADFVFGEREGWFGGVGCFLTSLLRPKSSFPALVQLL